MKKEEPRFVPGDKVICCDSSGPTGLVEGKSYIVNNLIRCAKCGIVGVSVGVFAKERAKVARCVCCGNRRPIVSNELYFRQTRFAFPEEVQQAEEAIRQLQNENLKV